MNYAFAKLVVEMVVFSQVHNNQYCQKSKNINIYTKKMLLKLICF